jgi:arylsulfatase A-like enzyme
MERHARERFFLFVHTYQVHAPYAPPVEYARRIPSNPLPLPPLGVRPSEKARESAAKYVAEVAFTDAALRPLFGALERLGIRDRTIVLVTSDHGEAFGEHGSISHGTSLFEEEVRVPMIWQAPGLIEPGRRVRGLAGLVDVTPTVLDLLGLPIPSWMQGRSLAPQIVIGESPPGVRDRVLPLHGYRASGMTGAGWKIVATDAGEVAFDLRVDAGEQHPIRGTARWTAVARRSRRQLEDECTRGQAALGADVVPSAPARIDPERERKLRALGYAE